MVERRSPRIVHYLGVLMRRTDRASTQPSRRDMPVSSSTYNLRLAEHQGRRRDKKPG